MEKIAFVVIRYGEDINGGAEYHCRMLAERLTTYYDVEVLTTCVKDYTTSLNEFEEGVEVINGVTVHRFLANADKGKYNEGKKIKYARKIRRLLYRMGLLKYMLLPFKGCRSEERLLFQHMRANSPTLLSFLEANKDIYKKVFFLTYNTPLSILGIDICKEKSIFIPTAHYESMLFLPILTETFKQCGHIAFNSSAEQRMCLNTFGKGIAENSIVGVKFNKVNPADIGEIKAKYGISDRYVLYVGRVDNGKLGRLMRYFDDFKKSNSDLTQKLVMVGGVYVEKSKNPDVIYTGFISDAEKFALIEHADVVINPSAYESLSLIALEAMDAEIPILVNGQCDVLKEHIQKSQAGFYYNNYKQFEQSLRKLLISPDLCLAMGNKGKEYVNRNYSWTAIIGKLCKIIES